MSISLTSNTTEFEKAKQDYISCLEVCSDEFFSLAAGKLFIGSNLISGRVTKNFYVYRFDEDGDFVGPLERSIVLGTPDHLSLEAVGMTYEMFIRSLCYVFDGEDALSYASDANVDLTDNTISKYPKVYGVMPDPTDLRYTFLDDGCVRFYYLGIPIVYRPIDSPNVKRLFDHKITIPSGSVLEVLFLGERDDSLIHVARGDFETKEVAQILVSDIVTTSPDPVYALEDDDIFDSALDVGVEDLYPGFCAQNGWMTLECPVLVNVSGPFEKGDLALSVWRPSPDGDYPCLVSYKKRDMSLLESMSYYYHTLRRTRSGVDIEWRPYTGTLKNVLFKNGRFVIPSDLFRMKVDIQGIKADVISPTEESYDATAAVYGSYEYNKEVTGLPMKTLAIYLGLMYGLPHDSVYYEKLGFKKGDVSCFMYRFCSMFPMFGVRKQESKFFCFLHGTDIHPFHDFKAQFVSKLLPIAHEVFQYGFDATMLKHGIFSLKSDALASLSLDDKAGMRWTIKKKKKK